MSRSYIDLLNLIDRVKFVEFESMWTRNVDLLGRIVQYLAFKAPVYIVIYGNRKFIDTYELYIMLEPYIACCENIIVFWEYSVESLFYHIHRLSSVKKGYIVIIIPYDRTMISQVENTVLTSLSKDMKKVLEKGWRIIIVNPVTSGEGGFLTFVTPFTYRLEFSGDECVLKPLFTFIGDRVA